MRLGELERGREKGGVATQAYPKVRADMLDRHKRLYLGSIGGIHTLFKLPVVSVCKHDKGAKAETIMSRKTISSPRTIAYKLATIWTIRIRGVIEQ